MLLSSDELIKKAAESAAALVELRKNPLLAVGFGREVAAALVKVAELNSSLVLAVVELQKKGAESGK